MRLIRVTDIGTWQHVASETFVPLRCSAGPEFAATIARHRVSPDLGVTRIRSHGHDVDRTPRQTAADGRDDLLLNLQLRGDGAVTQHGRTGTTAPGAMVLYETNEPYSIRLPSQRQDLIVVQFSRRLLGLSEQDIAWAAGRTISPEVPGQASLAAYLGSLQTQNFNNDGVGLSLTSIAGQLLATVLRSLVSENLPSQPNRAVQVAAFKASLRQQLTDPDLSVERLAAQHFVSVRQVHAVFAATGESPAAYLRRQRLERAAELLANRTHTERSVLNIARQSGYADPATFTRAFTRHFGVPPTRWAPK